MFLQTSYDLYRIVKKYIYIFIFIILLCHANGVKFVSFEKNDIL